MAPEIPTTHQDYTVIVRRHSFLAWKWYAYVGSEYNGTLVDNGCAAFKFSARHEGKKAAKKHSKFMTDKTKKYTYYFPKNFLSE